MGDNRIDLRETRKLRAFHCIAGELAAVVLVGQDVKGRKGIARDLFLGYFGLTDAQVRVISIGRASGKDL